MIAEAGWDGVSQTSGREAGRHRAGAWIPIGAVLVLALLAASGGITTAAPEEGFAFRRSSGRIEITWGGKPVAEYVYRDRKILRPYFAQLTSPSGIPVTRNHPPKSGEPSDHADMHPGLWLAFGDVNGMDYWRHRATVAHVRFVQRPRVEAGRLEFAVLNHYLDADRQPICGERARYALSARGGGYLLEWESRFAPEKGEVVFGDQEEMGLGVRVNSAITVREGGLIRNSAGAINEKGTWGKAFDWIEYSGPLDGKRVGVVLMADPANFGKCWAHSRDYGVVVANPFGRAAMKQGERSAVRVKEGESLRLRFGVLFYDAPIGSVRDNDAEFQHYVDGLRKTGGAR